ncbi:hypothetical protein HMPREF1045_1308 [Streptococcus mitis SK616]|nr:hypothetical protein HMPREF1045_1308 [Streptococcus mitis SK616]
MSTVEGCRQAKLKKGQISSFLFYLKKYMCNLVFYHPI